MIGMVIVAALLQQLSQQGPRSLDIDPSKVQPPVVVPAGTVIPVTLTSRISTKKREGRRRHLRKNGVSDNRQQ